MSKAVLNNVERIPADALFDIKQRFSKDSRKAKVDLGIGAYRDENGRPWVLPSVRCAEKLIQEDPNYNHEYLAISGLPAFTSNAARILLGDDSEALLEERVISVQSLSGTGALHIAAKFIAKFLPEKTVYFSDPTWANHRAIFQSQGVKTASYSYWDNETKSLDLEGYLRSVKDAPEGSIFVLHACAHNPTGLDPNERQWLQILEAIYLKDHIPIFDIAYQGFASGDLDRDALAVRLGIEKLSNTCPIFICQSFAKNLGLYGERVGCFHLVLPRQDDVNLTSLKAAISSQLAKAIRSEVSNSPAYGAKIAATILSTPRLTQQWHQDMITMSSRIKKMRVSLRERLVALGTPGSWDHIVSQCGMFSYTGLSPEMAKRLETKHAVYVVSSGRISIAGLNEGNLDHVAKAIDEVVRYQWTPSKL